MCVWELDVVVFGEGRGGHNDVIVLVRDFNSLRKVADHLHRSVHPVPHKWNPIPLANARVLRILGQARVAEVFRLLYGETLTLVCTLQLLVHHTQLFRLLLLVQIKIVLLADVVDLDLSFVFLAVVVLAVGLHIVGADY